MTTPTNAPEGVNAPALSAAPVLAGSTLIPTLGMTFTEADAKARELIQAHPAIEGEDTESEARRNELANEWHRINVTLFTTQGYRVFDRVGFSLLRDDLTQRTKGKCRFHARKRVAGGVRKSEALRKLIVAAS